MSLRELYRHVVLGYNPVAAMCRRFISRSLSSIAPDPMAPLQIVDFGAGVCPYRNMTLRLLPRAQYIPLDIAPGVPDTVICDIAATPLNSAAADIVFCFDVLQHVADAHLATLEIARVLKPGGYGLVTVPFLYAECDAQDYRRWTLEGIQKELQNSGLQVVDCRPRGKLFFLLGVLVASFVPLVFPRPSDWRSGGSLNTARNILVNLLVLPFQTLAWAGLAIDTFLPIRGAYMGSMILFKRN